MFEFSVMKKFLFAKKSSANLITCISLLVISSIVCLSLIFFSVIDGIEHRWLEKFTTLHPPLRVIPTSEYYSSYYYNIDALSGKSDYSRKSLREKLLSKESDPYSPESDIQIPPHWPSPIYKENGELRDLAQETREVIGEVCTHITDAEIADYEMGAALLHLSDASSYTSQIAYLGCFPESMNFLSPLLTPPTLRDISNLLSKNYDSSRKSYLQSIFSHLRNCRVRLRSNYLPHLLLPENTPFSAHAFSGSNSKGISSLFIPRQPTSSKDPSFSLGTLTRREDRLFFHNGKEEIEVSHIPITFDSSTEFAGEVIASTTDKWFHISSPYQKYILTGEIDPLECTLTKATPVFHFSSTPQNPPPWAHYITASNQKCQQVFPTNDERSAVILPSYFQSSGTSIGDSGYLSYNVEGGLSFQEHRAPIYVAGFYDPGPISTGMNYLFVPQNIMDPIKASPMEYLLDTTVANGFGIWTSNLKKTPLMQKALQKKLQQAGLDRFWKISHFSEYPPVKTLLGQFQSDRYIFSLVSALILLVACSNICSLLILLINNRKKEIAILTVMGASKLSIAFIFSACGLIIGLLSTAIGVGLGFFIMKNISLFLRGISALQGSSLLDSPIYQSLPHAVSSRALLYISIATPLCALLASLLPSIRLRHIDPKETLQT